MQARVAGDSKLVPIVLTPRELPAVAGYAGLKVAGHEVSQGSRTRPGLYAVAHYVGYASGYGS